jgi:undecaprenyl-diphosphatase
MELLKSAIMGLIQGLTEFLPVSSSGHLVLGSHLLGLEDGSATLEILVHFGTLVSVIVYFWSDIKKITFGTFKNIFPFIRFAILGLKTGVNKDQLHYPYYSFFIILASIPAAFVALFFKDDIESLFSSPFFALCALFVTGIILLLSRFAKQSEKPMSALHALLIGIAQACAILPGISRSGSTIVAGMFLGIKRETVAKFSFLMSLPVIFGAFILKLKDLSGVTLTSDQLLNYSVATLTAAISGYFAIVLVMNFIRKGKFDVFGYYCIFVSLLGLILI